jgi:hypothetical protein
MIQVVVDTSEESAWMQKFSNELATQEVKELSAQEVDYFHSGSAMEELGLAPTQTGYRIYISNKIKHRFKTAKRHDDTN